MRVNDSLLAITLYDYGRDLKTLISVIKSQDLAKNIIS